MFFSFFLYVVDVCSEFGVLTDLRTICRKDRLTVYKIEKKKIDFLKICQNKGLGKLVHKIYLSDRLEVYLFFGEFFLVLPMDASKFYPKIGTFVEARVYVLKAI